MSQYLASLAVQQVERRMTSLRAHKVVRVPVKFVVAIFADHVESVSHAGTA